MGCGLAASLRRRCGRRHRGLTVAALTPAGPESVGFRPSLVRNRSAVARDVIGQSKASRPAQLRAAIPVVASTRQDRRVQSARSREKRLTECAAPHGCIPTQGQPAPVSCDTEEAR
jgi:hypothetical protein